MKKAITLFACMLATGNLSAQGNTTWIASGVDPTGMKPPVPLADVSYRAAEADYTDGVFIVNEDWYGHQNSTVNFLTSKGEWHYRIFQTENPGHELGCTTQFGTIYGGKFYLISKQEKDPGASITGSRFAVCDARTMKVIKEFKYIAQDAQGKSLADGRSYLPVDEHKGYIGTSNGIWVYDSDRMTIGGQIAGTGNSSGSLYYSQIGTMIRANDWVFALHQQNGLLVIDPKTDRIVRTLAAPVETEQVNGKEEKIQRGFGSIVRSKDGTLWISLAQNTSGNGAALEYVLNLDPYTFQVDTVRIPVSDNLGVIPNSWYAWTADGFCASTRENKIYWNGQPKEGSWFTGYQICGYDIDRKSFFQLIDFRKLEGNWRLYGTGFRIHPATDELYTFFYHDFQDPTHQLVRVSSTGEVLEEYPMIVNYWFPAIPVFPDNAAPAISSEFPSEVRLTAAQPVYKLNLRAMATDADNMDAAIVKTVSAVAAGVPLSALVRNDSLVIEVTEPEAVFETSLAVNFNSNGRIVSKTLTVKGGADVPTANQPVVAATIRVTPTAIYADTDTVTRVAVYTAGGEKIRQGDIHSGKPLDISALPAGIYFIHLTAAGKTETFKIIRK